MHNCKTTRERMTELLLDGADPRMVLSKELRECTECREEFGALNDTLRLTTLLIETAAPADNYWPGYHARLKQKLQAAQQPRVTPGHTYVHRGSWFARVFTASIRVPVPVGLAVLVILGFLVFKIRVPTPPSIVQVPVEVPVVHEKTVTEVVYRDRPSTRRRSRSTQISPRNDSTVASLEGFKPAEEIKLTVIKGGSANEK